MKNFRISTPQSFSVRACFNESELFWMDPPYQRQSDVWPVEKRQYFIDSLINGFDIPKIYLHEFYPDRKVKGKTYRYAVIDGKQRFLSIWQFLQNEWPLQNKFEYLEDPTIKLEGLTYSELGEKYPKIRDAFNAATLPVVTIMTEDLELIEDLFSRLNEAVPLNAAEKRNSFGGPIPNLIRSIARHSFFTEHVPFSNRRYRHFDLVAKFLYFDSVNGKPIDTKKQSLDEFVKAWKTEKPTKAKRMEKSVRATLQKMNAIFTKNDPLLRNVSMIALYYLALKDGVELRRKKLDEFEEKRRENRAEAEKDDGVAEFELLEFDRLSQSPNDKSALEFRLKVLKKYLGHREKG
jgi:hypothetical protein